MQFSEKIKRLMLRQGLSQSALGEALGLSQRAVGLWLSGSRPHAAKAQVLADYFDIDVEVLMDDTAPLPGTAGALRAKEEAGQPLTKIEAESIRTYKERMLPSAPTGVPRRMREIKKELAKLHAERWQQSEREATLLRELEELMDTTL